VTVEEAFKNLKGDLAIRPIFHQLEARVEAHIFIAFLAYCLHVTLARRLHALAPGLTPRSMLEKFAAVQMIDVHLPTTDGRELLLTRYTEPEPELKHARQAAREIHRRDKSTVRGVVGAEGRDTVDVEGEELAVGVHREAALDDGVAHLVVGEEPFLSGRTPAHWAAQHLRRDQHCRVRGG
jgi:hypothetical protein